MKLMKSICDDFSSEGQPGCKGLATGHGDSLTYYQCFDQVEDMFKKVAIWMRSNPKEVIVLYFDELR